MVKTNKVELLKNLWASGISASAIAQKLGDNATRNSVIGKAHRLKLDARTISKNQPPELNKEDKTATEASSRKLGRKARFRHYCWIRLI